MARLLGTVQTTGVIVIATLFLSACVTYVGPGPRVFVPGHWQNGYWVPGHYAGPYYRGGAGWVPGHWNRFGQWIPGHYR